MMIYGFYMNVSSICNCIILFFSINHCWVVNNMDAGKISICNNWIRKWSGAEETIFDLAIFLCIRRRYSLLLSHACIIHIRLLNNGEWSDYWLYYQYFCWHTQLQIIKKYAKFSQDIYKFGNFAIITKRCFVRFPPKMSNYYWSRIQVEFFFLQLIIFVNSIITNEILSASILF